MSESLTSSQRLAALALRLLGLLLILLGSWQAVANLIDGWMEFDPTYLGYFFRSQLMRPALVMLWGTALILLSRPLGRCIAKGL